jgi:hypothetical protein
MTFFNSGGGEPPPPPWKRTEPDVSIQNWEYKILKTEQGAFVWQ